MWSFDSRGDTYTPNLQQRLAAVYSPAYYKPLTYLKCKHDADALRLYSNPDSVTNIHIT